MQKEKESKSPIKFLEGKVISDKMESTAIVEIINLVPHPLYKKIMKRRKKLVAHNPENKAKKGEVVRIVKTRPLSKTKRWRIVEIVGKNEEQTKPHNTLLLHTK